MGCCAQKSYDANALNKTKETPQGFTVEEIMDGSALDSLRHSMKEDMQEEEEMMDIEEETIDP